MSLQTYIEMQGRQHFAFSFVEQMFIHSWFLFGESFRCEAAFFRISFSSPCIVGVNGNLLASYCLIPKWIQFIRRRKSYLNNLMITSNRILGDDSFLSWSRVLKSIRFIWFGRRSIVLDCFDGSDFGLIDLRILYLRLFGIFVIRVASTFATFSKAESF